MVLLIALLVAPPAWAQQQRPVEDAPTVAVESPIKLSIPISTGRGALLMGSQILALSAGAIVSVALGSLWIEDNMRMYGRPDPRVVSANIAIALAVNMALTYLLLPNLARITNDANGTADVSFVRAETWRRTRWIAAAAALFAIMIGVGAVLEKNEFGRGQLVMAVGAGGSALAVLAFDITALLTVRSATNASRVGPAVAP